MTSVKVKYRASTIEGKEGAIYYQVIHDRVVRQIKTKYKVYSEEWDDRSSEIVVPKYSESRATYILTIKEHVKLDLNRLGQIVKSLKGRGVYSADDVVQTFEKQLKGVTLLDFMQSMIARLYELRKYRTSETYKTTLNSFIRFRGGEDLLLTDISSDMMMDYEAYLKAKGITNNSISL